MRVPAGTGELKRLRAENDDLNRRLAALETRNAEDLQRWMKSVPEWARGEPDEQGLRGGAGTSAMGVRGDPVLGSDRGDGVSALASEVGAPLIWSVADCRPRGALDDQELAAMHNLACLQPEGAVCAPPLVPNQGHVPARLRRRTVWRWVRAVAVLTVIAVAAWWFYQALGNPAAWIGPGELAEAAGRWAW